MATRLSRALPTGLRFEPTSKRIRARLGGVTVADSTHAVLVWEPDRVVPTYALPRESFAGDVLRPVGRPDPEHHAGHARVWTVVAGGREAPEAAWSYADEDLAGYVALQWRAMDGWLEEDEPVVGHPRDPFKRIDVRRSTRHVAVELEGELLADSRRPTVLFETHLPDRYYLPPADVRMDLLEPVEKRTYCAYKGEASYFSARAGGRLHEAVAWTYPDPLPDSPQIRGLVCFLNERADIRVDGELLERPATQWA